MLLGDTIILDTLDHANAYRQEVSNIFTQFQGSQHQGKYFLLESLGKSVNFNIFCQESGKVS